MSVYTGPWSEEKIMSVIDEIAAERRRQVEVEGWTYKHDDQHRDGSLAAAAACYAYPPSERGWRLILAQLRHDPRGPGPSRVTSWLPAWPWACKWWKPKDRRRDLIRAAALIVAEIERLDRAVVGGAAPAMTEPRSAERLEWRPIETAPKDGTPVLVAGPYDPVGIAVYSRGGWLWWADGEAIESQSDFGTEYKEYSVPTHWQPLPEPPSDD